MRILFQSGLRLLSCTFESCPEKGLFSDSDTIFQIIPNVTRCEPDGQTAQHSFELSLQDREAIPDVDRVTSSRFNVIWRNSDH